MLSTSDGIAMGMEAVDNTGVAVVTSMEGAVPVINVIVTSSFSVGKIDQPP